MPLIPFPSVPNYPGVPAIPRTAPGSPSINISIAPQQQEWVNETSSELPWGIYTQANKPIYSPTEGGTLSVLTFGFTRSAQVSDFPVEANNTNQGASFSSFNKVYQPSNPVITYAMSGSDNEKSYFLTTIDDACGSTTIYNVFMPNAQYASPTSGCTIERYSYQRTATHGATMLIVEVSLKQVLQVTAALSNVANGTTAITSPQSPSATSQVSNGITQPSTPPTSWLAQIFGGSTVGVK
jgi:hypothetical protein